MPTRTWIDNAFWENANKTVATAILEIDSGEGQVTRQVLQVRKHAPDGSENPDWNELLSQVPSETIDGNTEARVARKEKEAQELKLKRDEYLRAQTMEQLFEAKLKAFEIEDIKNSKNRLLKSKLRKAKNTVETAAYATLIIMDKIQNESETSE